MNRSAAAVRAEASPNGSTVVSARLPTQHGDFRVVAFVTDDGKEHAAIIKGDVEGAHNVPLRVHSECFTGDVMGSTKCDCRDQLHAALDAIEAEGLGVVLYLRQEGRGIGLVNKIRAYNLQDQGLDTVQANHALGFEDDLRKYDIAAQLIRQLGIASIELLTNNPKKVAGLKAEGIDVRVRRPHLVPVRPENAFYLRTKSEKSGHII